MSVMSDEETYKLLRDKIKSKMQVSKFFSGFVTIVFGFLLKDAFISTDTEVSYWIFAGVFLTVFSVSLSIAAMFCYDQLLMPPNFIKGTQLLKSINKVLKDYMILAWNRIFIPSIFSFFFALLFFANAKINSKFLFPLWLGFLVPILITFLLYVKFKSPSEYPD